MLPLGSPDRIHVAFDDHRLVANAGLPPAGHPGPPSWVWVSWWTATLTWRDAPGLSQPGGQAADAGGVGAGRRRLH